MKMNVYFLSTLLYLPVLIQCTSPLDKSPPRIPPSPNCVDKVHNCQDFLALCENNDFNRFMKEHCQKSCGHCVEGKCNSSEGFFELNNQCFKNFTKKARTWDEARTWCNDHGLELAEPTDPVALREYMMKDSSSDFFLSHALWLGARCTGTSVNWLSDGTIIPKNSSLWLNGRPDSLETTNCLTLLTESWFMEEHPDQPYQTSWCETKSTYYTLCESVTPLPPTTTTPATTTTTIAPTTTTAATTTTTPDFCVSVGGQCLFFENELKDWNDAVESCESKGQQLVKVTDPIAFNSFMTKNYAGQIFWLGGSDIEKEGHFVWLDGSPLVTFPWGINQPDNGGGKQQDCLTWGSLKNSFDDGFCNRTYRYICELEECSNPWRNIPGIIGRCYLFSTDLPDTPPTIQKTARDTCISYGGDLATAGGFSYLNADPLLQYNRDNNNDQKAWVGASRSGSSFQWFDGRSLSTDSDLWDPANPSGDGDCVEVDHGLLNDLSCTEHRRHFICEKFQKVPNGFENFNGRIIRRTVSSDRRASWDDAMVFCNMYGAKPFIPYTEEEYDLYKTVRYSLGSVGYMWLPANDRFEEGTLRWYNGQVATNISMWDWVDGKELADNAIGHDCLKYGPAVHLVACTNHPYPPICEIL